MLTRRELLAGAACMLNSPDAKAKVMTVRGSIPASRLGITLPHEHVVVDFIGADKVSPNRYDADEVYRTLLPHLQAARKQGITGFVECTPNYLARDVRLLKRLSRAADLHILTNTGLYKEPFLPPYAFTDSADRLAERWIKEAEKGIDGTAIRPGFIKIAVNPGPLVPVQKKIVRAAARTSKETGIVIACHTGHGPAALETMEILRDEKLSLSRYIFVHAEGETDRKFHVEVAKAGGWVEYDAIGWKPIEEHVKLVTAFLADGLIDRLLLSHDAGWYHVGEPKGGEIKPFTRLLGELIPALDKEGLTPSQRNQLLVLNPRRAFALTEP